MFEWMLQRRHAELRFLEKSSIDFYTVVYGCMALTALKNTIIIPNEESKNTPGNVSEMFIHVVFITKVLQSWKALNDFTQLLVHYALHLCFMKQSHSSW